MSLYFFFFKDTATTEIYTLSLHDALPILRARIEGRRIKHDGTYNSGGYLRKGVTPTDDPLKAPGAFHPAVIAAAVRSEEHTSELQSPDHLVCRLLLEKKKNASTRPHLRSA